MKKIFFPIFTLLVSFSGLTQEINAYKYVVVPKKFEFTKEADMYQVNSLTEFLFQKYGFDAFLEGEDLPAEVEVDQCKALYADVDNNSGLFVTRLNVILKDCRNNIIFSSEEGTSRSKDFKTAYHEALRSAFKSIGNLNYSYKPSNSVAEEKKSEPAKNESTPAIEEKTVIVTAIPEVPEKETATENNSEPSTSKSEEIKFTLDGLSYILRKSGSGYDLFQKGMAEPFAALIPSSTNKNFIYSSIKDQGIATFDEKGNLVIEVLNKETNSVEAKTYRRENGN